MTFFSDYFEFDDGSCWFITTSNCFFDLDTNKPGYTIFTNRKEDKDSIGTIFFDTKEQAIEAAKELADEKRKIAVPQTYDFWLRAVIKHKQLPIFDCVPDEHATSEIKKIVRERLTNVIKDFEEKDEDVDLSKFPTLQPRRLRPE